MLLAILNLIVKRGSTMAYPFPHDCDPHTRPALGFQGCQRRSRTWRLGEGQLLMVRDWEMVGLFMKVFLPIRCVYVNVICKKISMYICV